MMNMQGTGDFIVTGTATYHFNPTEASAYYNNTYSGTYSVSCTGGGGGGVNCLPGNQPATPAAPTPDPTEVAGNGQGGPGACQQNKCTFWSGGSLTGLTYTQQVKNVPGVNTKGNWTFTYNYAVTPNVASVDPETAWDLTSQTGGDGNAQINIDAQIAGESMVTSSQWPCASGTPGKASCGKFSFSLGNTDGTSRVQNLTITVYDSSGNIVGAPYFATSTLTSGITFAYTTNAGSNGNTQYLQNGDASTVLNINDVPGHGFGPSDLQEAIMTTVPLSLAAGTYNVVLTGVVKGNSGTADLPITVSGQVTVSAENCTAGQSRRRPRTAAH